MFVHGYDVVTLYTTHASKALYRSAAKQIHEFSSDIIGQTVLLVERFQVTSQGAVLN